MQSCTYYIQDFFLELLVLIQSLLLQNLLPVYLLKEWYVTKHLKLKMANGFIQKMLLRNNQTFEKKSKKRVIIGPSESMSKSKKNVIDPQSVIEMYGADAVRWFVLSDSPPERDIQWSDEGISGSYKFVQKVWNISEKINSIQEKKELVHEVQNDLDKLINKLIKDITYNIEHFISTWLSPNFMNLSMLFLRYYLTMKLIKKNIKAFLAIFNFNLSLPSPSCVRMLGKDN